VPVVSTDYSDIRDILPRPGQVVSERDPGLISAAIHAAAADRVIIAAEQRRWLKANATIDTAARNLEQVYQRYLRPHALAHPA